MVMRDGSPRRRKIWGWGYEGEQASPRAVAFAEASLGALFGGTASRRAPPSLDALVLPVSRVARPASLAAILRDDPYERALHALGRSYRDLALATRGRFPHPPDLVAYPNDEADLARLFDFAASAELALIPFGGGTSVAGGVEGRGLVEAGYRGVLTVDLSHLTGVLSIDRDALAAEILGGTLGPDVEAGLRPHGLTLRHYPQSFELSTLGGWIATRAGGHFATVYTHIDDLVESLRVATPSGLLETRRLPGSGAGPAPERLFLGSEGTLGVVVSAWMRVFERPTERRAATLRFASFEAGLAGLRAIVQAGLAPANCRLLDPAEALLSGMPGGDTLLLLAFESTGVPCDAPLGWAVDLARAHGGAKVERDEASDATRTRDGTADDYKAAFFRAPYLRDELVLRDVFVETFETAAVWSKLDALDRAVRAAVERLALGPHLLARRITHAYRDGCAPYYTLICRGLEGDIEGPYAAIKAAITDAILDAGGTSTHHHAIGRDVMPHYARERPELFAQALSASKRALDPRWLFNPGVLLPVPEGGRGGA